jgi:c-di-GMP-binding flagellar brake protein YcgR
MPPTPERRRKPRIDVPFSAKVQGTDENGESFEIDSLLDNFSAGGLYLRIARTLNQGAELIVLVQLPAASFDNAEASQIEARGLILRAEPQADGACGVALGFTTHRFI